ASQTLHAGCRPPMALILGTKSFDHDQCFALLRDGEPVFVYEAERFNRIKMSSSCDLSPLLDGLSVAGVRPDQIDLVTTAVDTSLIEQKIVQLYAFLGDERRAEADRTANNIRRQDVCVHSRLAADVVRRAISL